MNLYKNLESRSTYFWLGIIVIIALSLRMFHLDNQSLWVDEITSMNGADPDQTWLGVVKYSVSDQPPAFFLLLHGWFKIFPFNDFFGRLLSALIGVGGVVAMFFLGREAKNDRVGLTASAITTFSFIHIYFSQEARFYTLVFLSSALSYLFFIKAVKNYRVVYFFFYVLFTVLVIYTHYFGLIVFATQGILFLIIVIIYPFNSRFLRLSIGSGIAITLLMIPWIPIFFSDALSDFWIQFEPWYFLITYFYVYFKDVISCLVFGSLLIYYLSGVIKNLKTERRPGRVDLILIGSVTLSFLLPFIYTLIQTPLLQVRYTIIVLPCLIVMISLGFDLINIRLHTALLIICCSCAFFSLVVIEKHYSKMQKEDWRGMITAQLKVGKSPNDLYVSPKAWYCNYYFKSLHSDIRSILPESRNPSYRYDGIWWMDGFNLSDKTPEELKLMNEGYIEVKTEKFKDCRATYYKRIN